MAACAVPNPGCLPRHSQCGGRSRHLSCNTEHWWPLTHAAFLAARSVSCSQRLLPPVCTAPYWHGRSDHPRHSQHWPPLPEVPLAAMATNSNAHPLILPFQQPAAPVVCGSRCFSCRSLRGHHRFALFLPLLTVPSPPPPQFPCCTCCFCYRLPLSAFRPHVGRDYWFCWFLPLPLSMWHGFSQSCLTL